MRRLIVLLAALLLVRPITPAAAAGPTALGAGSVPIAAAAADFVLQIDGVNAPQFDLIDNSGASPRQIQLTELAEAACIGDLFGGQTLRLTGNGVDGAARDPVSLQIYLVDGGDGGPDRLSLKATRGDGRVSYFLPMRDLLTGSLSFACS
jgi:hypothetical protein